MNGLDLLAPFLYQNPLGCEPPQEIFSCRGCNNNLAGMDPASQYQRQKLIQNTVRVYASLYTMNLAALSAYRKPLQKLQTVEQAGTPYQVPPGVNWNQMSDRPIPSVQVVKTGSGSTYGASSTRNMIVRNRPGAMSPGGVGVDIKHNSYDRYLNRLKGKGPLRRGIIPPTYGTPIPFNRAFPIYGGKVVKTAIVNDCDCPIVDDIVEQDKLIYKSPLNDLQDQIYSVKFEFHVGDTVWVEKTPADCTMYQGIIQSIDAEHNLYTVKIVTEEDCFITVPGSHLMIYFQCNCTNTESLEEYILDNQFGGTDSTQYFDSLNNFYCSVLNKVAASDLL
jgi:hypothetical protein